MGTKNSAVLTATPADIISRKIGISRDTFIAAINSTRNELTSHLNSLSTFATQMGVESDSTASAETPRRGRPKGSKNKAAVKSGRKGAARKSGRVGRPKGSGGGTATKAAGGKRGRKAKSDSGVTLRQAVENIVRGANGSVAISDIVDALPSQGVSNKGKNVATMVSQVLGKLVKTKSVTRPERGKYEWSASRAPVVTDAVIETENA
jgi:hypothetical protein